MMSKDLTDSEKLNLILAKLSGLETIAGDLSDTRPLLDSLHAYVDRLGADLQEIKAIVLATNERLTAVEKELHSMNRQLTI